MKTISIRDTGVRKGKKENFYPGILLGLLSHMEEWDISSNAESLRADGMKTILKYGIACYKKKCRVVLDTIAF